jgi:hypothetical protein
MLGTSMEVERRTQGSDTKTCLFLWHLPEHILMSRRSCPLLDNNRKRDGEFYNYGFRESEMRESESNY